MPNDNTALLASIRSRQEKATSHNGGILTADRYVKTIEECVGSDLCYRYAAKGAVSFQDAIKRASNTLTYNNSDMVIEDVYAEAKTLDDIHGHRIDLPKNTLMVFKHVLTTPKRDRDGDILRTRGAQPDPRMLLLWQHVHTLPIGKMLGVIEHTSKKLVVASAVIDMNDLSHDSAVMIDNGMGRFSHGFKALEFEKIKEQDGRTTGGGFDVKMFEIMEESLVSVPSNTDAETQEIIYSMVSGGKLTSPMYKSIGKSIKANRPEFSAGGLDLNINVNVNGTENEKAKTKPEGCSCGGGSSEKADDDSDEGEGRPEGWSEDKKKCPKCNSPMKDGKCAKCGYSIKDDEEGDDDNKDRQGKGIAGDESEDGMKCPKCGKMDLDASGTCQSCGYIQESSKSIDDDDEVDGEKAGRTLNRSNYTKLKSVRDDLKEIHEMHCATRSGKALCDKCYKTVSEIIESSGQEDPDENDKAVDEVSAKDAMGIFLAKADIDLRERMRETLIKMNEIDQRSKTTESYKKMIGRS